MSQTYTPNLIEILRAAMEDGKRTSGIHAEDPSLPQLRTILDRRVADLERSMASEFVQAAAEAIGENSFEEPPGRWPPRLTELWL